MEVLKCPNCGGNIMKAEEDVYFCPYCGIGIAPNVKKVKVSADIKKEEKKNIVVEHKDKAELLDKIMELLFFIIVIVLGIIWATHANFKW